MIKESPPPISGTALSFAAIREGIAELYLNDPRPWLVGFSGGKDSTMVASLIFEAIASLPPEERTKPVSILCTDTRVEIPAIVGMIDGTLARMTKFAEGGQMNVSVHLLRLQPDRTFRWYIEEIGFFYENISWHRKSLS